MMVALAPIYFGEEFGWTAYLRGALADLRAFRARPTLAAATTGAVWGAWHWPLASVGYFGFTPPVRDVLLLIPLWVIMSMLLEIAWSALWYGSGTIWTTSVAHAGFNLVFSATLGAFLPEEALVAAFVVPSVALVPVVAVILVRARHTDSAESAESGRITASVANN
ncbi:CPBP family intramembrane glutamic endopeptidase [Tsukamurella sp. PLM1]|uniref:CPBP family intramembrane glutamic endopeptidase n=1 Tax=Tsukamurella sp. PLM1 TaxID=2929795 RepID=UPI00205CAD16|nr:CPBP family intramembrane glutamic endopeptidase [Tsukamurella sp. PLM1]BDH57514.1 hypothetical protein MTP03_24530 [Tsukamurella sp. PLM1]